MASDPALLELFRRQCHISKMPWATFLVWKMSRELSSGEVEQDDLIDITKEVAVELYGNLG